MKRALTWSVLTAALVLAGCASPGPSRTLLPTVDPAKIGLVSAAEGGAELAATDGWWKAFGDAQLDALVERAVADHPGVQAASARLLRAQAAGRGVDAAGQATAGLSVDMARQRYTANGLIPAPVGSVDGSIDRRTVTAARPIPSRDPSTAIHSFPGASP